MTADRIRFNPAPPKPGATLVPAGAAKVLAERGQGHLVIVQPVAVGKKAMPMVSIGVWWTTADGFHAPDGRRTCMLHQSELPALMDALKALLHSVPRTPALMPASAPHSLQDRALVLLATGLGPRDLPGRLWPDDPPNPRRITELGKALRRAELLVPGDWTLTLAGEARAASLSASPQASPSFPPLPPSTCEEELWSA